MKNVVLDEEQVWHLVDLLEMNVKEKEVSPPSFMSRQAVAEAIAYDNKIINNLKNAINSK